MASYPDGETCVFKSSHTIKRMLGLARPACLFCTSLFCSLLAWGWVSLHRFRVGAISSAVVHSCPSPRSQRNVSPSITRLFPCIEIFDRLSKYLWCDTDATLLSLTQTRGHPARLTHSFGSALQVVEFFTIVTVSNVSPVTIHHGKLTRIHVRQKDITIMCCRRISKCGRK